MQIQIIIRLGNGGTNANNKKKITIITNEKVIITYMKHVGGFHPDAMAPGM